MDWTLPGVAVHLLVFWRVVVAVGGAMLVAWIVSEAVDFNTAYPSYAMLVGSLIAGIGWELRVRRKHRRIDKGDIQA